MFFIKRFFAHYPNPISRAQQSHALGALGVGCCLLLAPLHAFAQEVNVYSQRQPFLIKPLLQAFTQKTHIKVNVVYAKKGLVQRIRHEGTRTKADMLLTTDVRPLAEAAKQQLLYRVPPAKFTKAVPAAYRHPEHLWWGVSLRARVIYASKARTKPGDITRYADLALPKWRGKVCIRSAHHPYNVSLFASLLAHMGAKKTKQWLQRLKQNFARKPQGNDRAQMRAIYEGLCDVTIANSYYMGKMLENPKQRPWADAVTLIFPKQGHGTHVNISGAAILKHAKHKQAATQLLAFLLSPAGQNLYAQKNYEHPVVPNTPWPPLLKTWGVFKSDPLPLTQLLKHIPSVVKLVDELGLN